MYCADSTAFQLLMAHPWPDASMEEGCRLMPPDETNVLGWEVVSETIPKESDWGSAGVAAVVTMHDVLGGRAGGDDDQLTKDCGSDFEVPLGPLIYAQRVCVVAQCAAMHLPPSQRS